MNCTFTGKLTGRIGEVGDTEEAVQEVEEFDDGDDEIIELIDELEGDSLFDDSMGAILSALHF